jgi:hypothetical protein
MLYGPPSLSEMSPIKIVDFNEEEENLSSEDEIEEEGTRCHTEVINTTILNSNIKLNENITE